jgi:hypothetical protein
VREKYYRRNGYASEEVERIRAEGRWLMCGAERKRETETRTSRREGRDSENRGTTGSMRGA